MASNDSRVPFDLVQAEPARRRLLIAVIAALALAAGVAGVVVGAGHDGDGGETAADVPTPGRGAPEERVSFLARIVPPPAQRERGGGGAAVPRSVADLARRLPVERKVAQLFLLGFRGTDLTSEIFGRLRRLDLGGIVVAGQNYTDVTQLGGLAGEAAVIASQRAAREALGDDEPGGRRAQLLPRPSPRRPSGGPRLRGRGGRDGEGVGVRPARPRRERRARSGRGRGRRRPARRSALACTPTSRTRSRHTPRRPSGRIARSTCSARSSTSRGSVPRTSRPRRAPPRSGSAWTSCGRAT